MNKKPTLILVSILAMILLVLGWWLIIRDPNPPLQIELPDPQTESIFPTEALNNLAADANGDGLISVQEEALMAEEEQRTYMHDVVFGIPEFVEMYHQIGVEPELDPTFPDVIIDDAIGEGLFLTVEVDP